MARKWSEEKAGGIAVRRFTVEGYPERVTVCRCASVHDTTTSGVFAVTAVIDDTEEVPLHGVAVQVVDEGREGQV